MFQIAFFKGKNIEDSLLRADLTFFSEVYFLLIFDFNFLISFTKTFECLKTELLMVISILEQFFLRKSFFTLNVFFQPF